MANNNNNNRELRSNVWEFFDYQPPSPDGREDAKAICKVCRRALSANSGNGTRHLWGHVSSTNCMKVIAQAYDDLQAKGLVDI